VGLALDTKGRKTSFVQSDSVVRNIVRGEKEESCICVELREGRKRAERRKVAYVQCYSEQKSGI
jgi:hypothetical protein